MLRSFMRSVISLVLGIYSLGFAYTISRAAHPDIFLPFEVFFFISSGAFLLSNAVYELGKVLKSSCCSLRTPPVLHENVSVVFCPPLGELCVHLALELNPTPAVIENCAT